MASEPTRVGVDDTLNETEPGLAYPISAHPKNGGIHAALEGSRFGGGELEPLWNGSVALFERGLHRGPKAGAAEVLAVTRDEVLAVLVDDADDRVIPGRFFEALQNLRIVAAADVVVDAGRSKQRLGGLDDERVTQNLSPVITACLSAGDLLEEEQDRLAGLGGDLFGLFEVTQPFDLAEFFGLGFALRVTGYGARTDGHNRKSENDELLHVVCVAPIASLGVEGAPGDEALVCLIGAASSIPSPMGDLVGSALLELMREPS